MCKNSFKYDVFDKIIPRNQQSKHLALIPLVGSKFMLICGSGGLVIWKKKASIVRERKVEREGKILCVLLNKKMKGTIHKVSPLHGSMEGYIYPNTL